MKKQILFLAFFTLAIFIAGTTKVMAQVHVSDPLLLNCADTLPLHPRAGVPYKYIVETPSGNPVGQTDYTWWVTKNPNFIDTVLTAPGDPTYLWADTTGMLRITNGELINAVPGAGTYGNIGPISNHDSTITITWSSEILAATEYGPEGGDASQWQSASSTVKTPTFVAVLAQGSCTDNLEVFEINPSPAFTVDIRNLAPDLDNYVEMPYFQDTAQCVDVVRKAVYNSSTHEIEMDYGADTLYFEVVATNYVSNWYPYFIVQRGLYDNQTADVTLHRNFTGAKQDSALIGALVTIDASQVGDTIFGSGNDIGAATQISQAAGQDNSQGISIFVKVVVHHNDYELDGADMHDATGDDFVLSLDGRDDNNTGDWDLENNNPTADPCTTVGADQVDESTHTLLPRPTIEMLGGPMNEPSTVDPEDLINKTNDNN
jgi:hypothetical protein